MSSTVKETLNWGIWLILVLFSGEETLSGETTNDINLTIGGRELTPNAEGYTGNIDDTMCFSKSLSDDEITSLFGLGALGNPLEAEPDLLYH